MKLISPELEQRFVEVGKQSDNDNPLIITKFYNPIGSHIWYACEYNSTTKTCFGLVTGLLDEKWGYFSIDELEKIRLPNNHKIQVATNFREQTYNALLIREAQFNTHVKGQRFFELNQNKHENNQDLER